MKKELAVVRKTLGKNKELYRYWRDMIATAFENECYRAGIKHRKVDIASNKAAETFLDMLISGQKKRKDWD